MEMPFETRQQLEQLENIVKEICARNQEQTMREIEPYINAISSIRMMYPNPLFIPLDMITDLLGEQTK